MNKTRLRFKGKPAAAVISTILTLHAPVAFGQVLYEASLNGKSGFIDQKSEWIVPPTFDTVGDMDNCGYFSFMKNGREGIADIRGNIVLQPVWNYAQLPHEGVSMVFKGDSTGYISISTGRAICPFFLQGSFFSEWLAAVQCRNGKWGYINTHGKVVISFKYKSAGDFHEGAGKVQKGKRHFFINKKGKKTREPSDYAYYWDDKPERTFMLNGKYGMVSSQGDTLLKPVYDMLENIAYDEYTRYSLGGKFGIADTNGHILCPPLYDTMGYVFSGHIAARLNGKWGYIDIHGKVIIPFRYEEAASMIWGAQVKWNGKWGVIDDLGEWIIPPRFEYIGSGQSLSPDSCVLYKKEAPVKR